MNNIQINHSWTLFLDRDGVINKKIENGYVTSWSQFQFLPGVLEALSSFRTYFNRIIVITNQQGIGKGLMTIDDLNQIHAQMLQHIEKCGGKIDAVYFCAELEENNPTCRKPNTGMALQAKKEFPDIDFSTSIMVGDSFSDMEFAQKLGMHGFYISSEKVSFGNKITTVKTLADIDPYLECI